MDMQLRLNNKDNRTVFISAALLAFITLAVSFISGLNEFSFENRQLSAFSIIVSAAVIVLHIVLCIFMRIKRTSRIAKALFCYQLAGSALYIIHFIFFIFSIPFASFFHSLFHAWSFALEPVSVAIGRLMGIRAKYIAAIFYLALTFITGKTAVSIRKDISYERKYAEDHTFGS